MFASPTQSLASHVDRRHRLATAVRRLRRQPPRGRNRIASTCFAAVVFAAAPAAARQVSVPLRIDYPFLERLLVEQTYTDPESTAQVFRDQTGCNYLTLKNPSVAAAIAGRLQVVSEATARIGAAVGDHCLAVLDWKGTVELLETVEVDPALPILRFHIADSNLYGAGERKRVTGTLWDWVKRYVHPRLESLTVDLHQPLLELRSFLPAVLPHQDSARLEAMLDSLSLADARAEDAGLHVDLRIEAPERTETAAPRPEPTLTAEEIRRWEEAWQSWDAFLTFVVKQAAADAPQTVQRRALLTVLIDARYDLLEALAPTTAAGTDPVRALFVRAWTDLAPVLRRLGMGLPGEKAAHYMSFIAAADALQALDALGPDLGVEISADGLRRLARIIAPAAVEDPVRYSEDVDPALREVFGLGEPLSVPSDDRGASPWFWFVAPAWAGDDPLAGPLAQLRRWAPTRADLPVYLPLVRELLGATAAQLLENGKLDARYHSLFRWLTLATAWQESCWRQFVRQGGEVKTLLSAAGSVGLMQVNQHVWRGFYDVRSLRENIAYNATAGDEILALYLNDYAIAKGEHKATGNVDDLARATYAAYNGGPSHLRRYRKKTTKRTLRRIDEAFWKKYRTVKKGEELAVADCFGG